MLSLSLRSSLVFLLTATVGGTAFGAPAEATRKVRPVPPERSVVGSGEALHIVPDLSATAIAGTERVWRRSIGRPNASFVKVHLVDVNLRGDDRLVLRAASGRVVEEIRRRGPKDRGTFWSLAAFGEELELELRVRHDYPRPPFSIDRVIFGEIPLPLAAPPLPGGPESICAPPDFEDVICYQSDLPKWANVQASVGVMSVGGDPDNALFCSGSNVSPESFVLTNQHCVENQAVCDDTEFVFRYYRTGCADGSPPTQDWQSFRCDEIVASSPFISCDQGLDDLDFILASVLGDPAATFGFVDPDPVPLASGEDIYIVQHPDGRPHEITHGGGANVVVSDTVLRYYDTLDTEGGSSGSPIFREADDRLVGLHHCGGCETPSGNRGMLMSDIYPHIEPFLCTPEVALGVVDFTGLAEVLGNGDGVLDPGETWQLTPRVRNTACNLEAINVTGELVVDPLSAGPLTITDGALDFGDVGAGAIAEAAAPVELVIGPGAPCGGELLLDIDNLMADNGPPGVDLDAYRLPLGDSPRTTLLFADFVTADGWSVEDGGTGSGPARTWALGNPGNRELSLTEPFAIVDSDALGVGELMDESLISPPVDVSGFSEVFLQFRHDFEWFFGGDDEQGDVDVRPDPTAAWTTVANFSGASSSGTVTIDITAVAAEATELQVRFHYYNAEWEWWWAVDDVFVLGGNGFVCEPFDQGLNLTLTSLECPGPAAIELTNATPFAPVILGAAFALGDAQVPNGTCAGTQTDIEAPLFTRRDVADANGTVLYQFTVPDVACGGVMQALDLADCSLSDPVAIEP